MHLDKCCFYLHLKTGCFIISAINIFYGTLMFLEEILNTVFKLGFIIEDKILTVAFVDDLTPSLIVLFSLSLLYGTYKANPIFVFTGVSLTVMQLLLNCFTLFIALLITISNQFTKYPPNTPQLIDKAVGSVFLLYFVLIINGHYKELKKETSVEMSTNRGFVRVENEAAN